MTGHSSVPVRPRWRTGTYYQERFGMEQWRTKVKSEE